MTSKLTLFFGALAATFALAIPTASAIVAPRNCGTTTISGKRYQVKADQIRCTTAKDWTRRYILTSRKPKGWSCRKGSAGSKLKFTCDRGSGDSRKTFFAIKR